jgi:hypothetical protein
MEKKANLTPTKLSISTVTSTNDSKMGKVLDKEFFLIIIKMINEIKEDMYKCLNKFQENINK